MEKRRPPAGWAYQRRYQGVAARFKTNRYVQTRSRLPGRLRGAALALAMTGSLTACSADPYLTQAKVTGLSVR